MKIKEDNKDRTLSKVKKLGLESERYYHGEMSKRCKKITNKAKLKHRSEIKLEDWEKLGYYKIDWAEQLLSRIDTDNTVPREEAENLSLEDFREKYEKKNIPVIIKGVAKNWPALSKWTFQSLYEKYKNAKVKVGEDDDEYKIKIKLKYFFEYLIYNQDDSPLYLFESSIENHNKLNRLMDDYEVPNYFKEDLFKYVGEEKRPPYRWFLIGPERSGTSIHIDPLGTNAWNTSIQGHKLWMLLPPEVPRYIAKGKEVVSKGEDDEAIMYMLYIIPRIVAKYNVKPLWFIQNPGESVFIPGGWWHVVVNLDDTVAITQNYCNSVNFDTVWKRVRHERKKMAVRFLQRLQKYRPDLYERAIELNKRDGFTMYDKKFLGKKRGSEKRSTSSASSSSSSSSSYSSDSSDSFSS
jgi:histone arginine demethylase JMJD6